MSNLLRTQNAVCTKHLKVASMNQQNLLHLRCVSVVLVMACLGLQEVHAEDTNVKDVPSKTIDTAKKQIPSNKAAVEGQAKFLKENAIAAPLPAGSSKLDAMRERSKALLEKHTTYMKAVAEGKIDPSAHLRKLRPQHEKEVQNIKNLIGSLSREEDVVGRKKIGQALFLALQPVGSMLEHASVGKGYANKLSKDQQAELGRLEAAWGAAAQGYPENVSPLVTVGSGRCYTLTNLDVPIIVKAPPESTVIFRSHGGGFFSNKLPIIEVKADKSGVAKAEWVTYGDSVADTQISIRSLSAPSAHNLIITTVQPKLRGLPPLSMITDKNQLIPKRAK